MTAATAAVMRLSIVSILASCGGNSFDNGDSGGNVVHGEVEGHNIEVRSGYFQIFDATDGRHISIVLSTLEDACGTEQRGLIAPNSTQLLLTPVLRGEDAMIAEGPGAFFSPLGDACERLIGPATTIATVKFTELSDLRAVGTFTATITVGPNTSGFSGTFDVGSCDTSEKPRPSSCGE